MSMQFYMVKHIEVEQEPSFDLSSNVYEVLLGDRNMPMGSDGATPVAVEVPIGALYALLDEALLITEDDRNEYERQHGNDHEFWFREVGKHIHDAAAELGFEGDPQAARLLADFRTALKNKWGGVAYSTYGANYAY